MRIVHSVWTVVLLAVCYAQVGTANGQAQKPVESSAIISEYEVPPDSLLEFARDSDAVIVAQVVEASTREEYGPSGRGSELKTRYSLEVTEIIKASPKLPGRGANLTIEREGGEVMKQDRIVRQSERGFPAFKPGETYLMFLGWSPYRSSFVVRLGPHGCYRITNGTLQSPGKSQLAAHNNGRSLGTVMAELRSSLR